ncbi:MAG: transcription elongation factor GreA [Deinococcales bacterium]
MAKKKGPVYLTPQGLQKIKDELVYLTEVRRQELTEYMGSAIADGDLRESAAYDEARLLQSANEARIADLEEILARAVTVEYQEGDSLTVRLGATVELEDVKSKETFTFHLVGTHEADFLQGYISDESPLGMALMGRQPKDKVRVQMGKRNIDYKVLNVSFE